MASLDYGWMERRWPRLHHTCTRVHTHVHTHTWSSRKSLGGAWVLFPALPLNLGLSFLTCQGRLDQPPADSFPALSLELPGPVPVAYFPLPPLAPTSQAPCLLVRNCADSLQACSKHVGWGRGSRRGQGCFYVTSAQRKGVPTSSPRPEA